MHKTRGEPVIGAGDQKRAAKTRDQTPTKGGSQAGKPYNRALTHSVGGDH